VREAEAQKTSLVDATWQPGQVVDGKYRVDHLVGKGGMAAVWAGTNVRTGKRVALKVILQALATTPAARKLFHREALAASRVDHPNVVTIFDVIEHQGMACIVMELLDGEPLGHYLARRGCLSIQEAVFLLLPAMRGVAAAHARGVVHRDLKPHNIFLCFGPDGRVVTTKVLDFGISVVVERVVDPSTAGPGLAMGTPGYMSPEHISGLGVIDARADVYGFGLLLYESLTGRMAFPGDPEPELFERILSEPPQSVALLRPDLPQGLVRIIEKAMAKRPEDRHPNLDAMVNLLEEEVMPLGLSRRSLTPLAGMPLLPVSSDRLAGQRDPVAQAVPQKDAPSPHPDPTDPAAQAVARKEPSGPHPGVVGPAAGEGKPPRTHQRTKILFGFSFNDGRSSGVRHRGDDQREPALPSPADSDTAIVNLRPGIFRAQGLSALRNGRAFLGVGLGVALVVGAWTAMRELRTRSLTPPLSTTRAIAHATESAVPTPSPRVVAIPPIVPAPEATSPSSFPSESATLAADEHVRPTSRTGASGGREAAEDVSPHRLAARSASRREEPLPVARRAGASVKTAPRAGSLSADDF